MNTERIFTCKVHPWRIRRHSLSADGPIGFDCAEITIRDAFGDPRQQCLRPMDVIPVSEPL